MDERQPGPSSRRSLLSLGSLLVIGWTVFLGFLAPGCRDQTALTVDRNIPPETVITGAPGDSQTSFYRVRLFWDGFDQDGEVVGFEWAITESVPNPDDIQYHFTTRTDSTFRFPVEPNREILGSRFYVRAIDDDGRRDPTPAFTFFSARNTCAPVVSFVRAVGIGPRGEVLPITSTSTAAATDTIPAGWSVSFAWTGSDCDVALESDGTIDTVGSVDHYLYHLSPLEVTEIGGTAADTAVSYPATILGSKQYTLFVRAVDDAGFAGLDPAVRSFVWNRDPEAHWSRALLPGRPDSVSVFYADTLGTAQSLDDYEPFTSGDTLPALRSGIPIWGRVRGFDPDDPTGSGQPVAFEARVVEDTDFWHGIGPSRIFTSGSNLNQERGGNGWRLMCRCQDRYGRWDGTPDTLVFYINRAPRFITEWTIGDQSFAQSPQPGQVVQVEPGQLTIPVLFRAIDPDPRVASRNLVEYRYKFDSYTLPGVGTYRETFYQPAAGGIPGDSRTGVWSDEIVLQEPDRPFQTGTYRLSVIVQESRPNQPELGQRPVRRTIDFTIEER
jgi:hypothetical protein